MADMPENLQVIKLEPPGTPEKANIKERLNLHVKRRLQQETPELPHNDVATPVNNNSTNKRGKPSQTQAKEVPKPRKPYHKRVEKVKTESSKGKKTPTVCASAERELDTYDESADLEASPETPDARNQNRDRYKSSDILSTVLSRKKRALMHDPQVQLFWSQIMSALRE